MHTLLVVDDELAVRQLIAMAMTRRNWRVLQADCVRAALAITAARRVDVVLCDIVMPGGGAFELLHAFQSAPTPIPVILMTGHPLAARQSAHDEVPVLEKPFTLKLLVAVVDKTARQGANQFHRYPASSGMRTASPTRDAASPGTGPADVAAVAASAGRKAQVCAGPAPVSCKVVWGS